MSNHPLPHGLTQIAEAAGTDAALTLTLARGGSRFRIPQRAEGSLLAEIVGLDAAQKIVKDLADERIEIPLAKKIVAAWLYDQGWSQERIAMRLKVSRRTVQYWQSGTTPTRQTDLFSAL
jgi:hypothetical protein